MRFEPADERFWTFVEETDTGCWVWTGYTQPRGYGNFDSGGKIVLAHRWAYEYVVGVIPAGLELDHLCLNKPCVNPAHLEPVTRMENVARRYALLTHCRNGHPYTASTTSTRKRKGAKRPGKVCLICERQATRRHRARRRERERIA